MVGSVPDQITVNEGTIGEVVSETEGFMVENPLRTTEAGPTEDVCVE